MVSAVITCDLMGIYVCIIMLCIHQFSSATKNNVDRAFTLFGVELVLYALVDVITYILPTASSWDAVAYFFITMTFVLGLLVFTCLNYYMYTIANDSNADFAKKTKKIMYTSLVFVVISVLLCIFKKSFYVVDSVYRPQSGVYIHYGMEIILLIMEIIALATSKFNLKRTRVYIALYMITPFAGIIIELINPEWTFAAGLSCTTALIIYLTLQDDRSRRLNIEKEIAQENAMVDPLTGLYNRRALEGVSKMYGPRPVAVIYADLNSLKYANDKYGHQAGDNLIVSFSRIMLEEFDKDDIYRIGGDEFIVVLKGISRENYELRLANFKKKVKITNISIAAIGGEYDNEAELQQLIYRAEQQMYKDKAEHSKDSKYSRK